MSERHHRLAAALPQPAVARVADLGCGGGLTLAALRERLGPDVELIGVERREPELVPALAGDPRLSTVVADLNKPLPFEDDVFYVLDGELTFDVGHGEVAAPAGTFVLVPPGVEHTFANRTAEPVRVLNIHAPAGFDRRLMGD